MLACTYVLTRLAVGRALRPVRTMTDQATQWSAVASEERFGHTRHPAELARLGTSLDAIPGELPLVAQEGELSHELGTPLSRIIAELDRWQTHPRTADQTHATHKVIAEASQTMRTICDTLLDDARGGTLTAPGTAEVLPTLRRLAEVLNTPSHLTIAVDGPPLEAGIPPALLQRVVSPLLTNTCRYARSHIAVRAYHAPDGVRIDVIDDGPGVPPLFAGQPSSPAGARIPATDTAERASDCRRRDVWPAPPAAR
ncbi:hypothetical protein GCM10010300_34670 [Streptomyces olivaceoviridis]|nr:hypothetical protein GCM10010300_34670 [Streptomyces olivaceoviridis]